MKKSPRSGIPGLYLNLLVCLLLSATCVFGQVRTITGTVQSALGGVPDVAVSVKNSAAGTITDSLGRYSIQARTGDLLVFSSTEYKSVEIQVTAGSSVIDVSLSANISTLNEVVVIGYGSQSKRNVTGSVAKVDVKSTQNLPNTNISQALRGRVAGVQFTDNGRPGQNGNIIIRGQRSLNASNDPLIILDGIFFHGSKSDINFNDVESMEVLKDASASAIYGSRAANGVILITTKKGTTEKPMIRYNTFYGVQDHAYKVKWLGPQGYIQKTLDIREQSGLPHNPADIANYLTPTEADNYKNSRVVIPHDEVTRQGQLYAMDISVSGRSKNTNYYLSAALANDRGLVYGDKQDRKTFRVNLETNVNSWLKVGTNTTLSIRDGEGVPVSMGIGVNRLSPFGTWYRADGSPTQFIVPEDQGIAANPMRQPYLETNTELENNLFSNAYAIISVPGVNGLKYRVNYSNGYRWLRDYNFEKQDPYLSTNNTLASKRNRHAYDWVLENILTYQFSVGDDHDFDATLLYGSKGNSFETTTATNRQFATDLLGWNNLGLGALPTVFSDAQATNEVSSMARLNYRYKDRYLFTLTARRDGSSVFAKGNKYSTFPSGAFAWILSEESFIKKIQAIDMLKLRLSYGAVGNQAISPYQSLALAGTNTYVFGDQGTTAIGILPSNISSSGLKWETTYSTNIALDFSLFKGKLGGSIELYNMATRDLLVERTLPSATGFSSIWTNLGEVNNRGIEVTLNSVNVKTRNFQWSTDFVFSYNRNRIVSLYGGDADGDGKEDNDISNGWFIGQPINVYYDFIFDGIYQKGDVIPAGSKAGFARFKDLNGDGVVTAQYDRGIVGPSVNPKFRWGLTNTFSYGNLSLSVFINAMQGWKGVYNEMDHYYTGDPMRPVNKLDIGWWTDANASTTRPSLLYNRSVLGHSWYLSRDFIRIQDVSLGYTFPKKILDKLGVANLNVFAGVKNLATFTDWLGTNPEVITSYPLPRTYSMGLKVGF